jgi:hypothetical protein
MSSEEGNVQGVAENSSMLVARRQQRMIIDASIRLIWFHRHTTLLSGQELCMKRRF